MDASVREAQCNMQCTAIGTCDGTPRAVGDPAAYIGVEGGRPRGQGPAAALWADVT